MFCNKCGKQIPDGRKFCQYCGAQVEDVRPVQLSQSPNQQVPLSSPSQAWSSHRIGAGFSAFEILIIVFMGLIALMWLVQTFANIGYTNDALSFIESRAGQVMGMILYLLPPILILALEVVGGRGLWKRQYIISIGALLFLISLVMKIGS